MTASGIVRINGNKTTSYGDLRYNPNGIYAGTLTRDAVIGPDGYIDLELTENGKPVAVDVPAVWSVTNNSAGITVAGDMVLTRMDNDVRKGDQVIYVMNGANVAYIVDLGNPTPYSDNWKLNQDTPSWLRNIWTDIMDEQGNPEPDEITFAMKVKGKDVVDNKVTLDKAVAADTNVDDWVITTNATSATVLKNNAADAGTLAGGTYTGGKTDLGSAKITYSIVLRNAKGTTRTETVEVSINDASTNNEVTAISVKGVAADRVLNTNVWNVKLTNDQSIDATVEQIAVTTMDNRVLSVTVKAADTTGVADTIVKNGASFVSSTKATAVSSGALVITVTAESGDQVDHTINITAGVKAGAPTLAQSGTTNKSVLAGAGTVANPYVLTVGALVDLTKATDVAGTAGTEYLKITETTGTTAVTAVSVSEITLTTTETGKEPVVTTVQWKNEDVEVSPTINASATGLKAGLSALGKIVLDNTTAVNVPVSSIITGWTTTSENVSDYDASKTTMVCTINGQPVTDIRLADVNAAEGGRLLMTVVATARNTNNEVIGETSMDFAITAQ